MLGPVVSVEEGRQYRLTVRFIVYLALLCLNAGVAVQGFAREPYSWVEARIFNLVYALTVTAFSIGIATVLVLMSTGKLYARRRRWTAWLFAGTTFLWASTVGWVVITPQPVGSWLADALLALGATLMHAAAWRTELFEDRRMAAEERRA